MKVGIRKPSIKKSIKARTTGKAKRVVKKAVVPGYGKKGTGIYKNPKKAVYNKVYNKTTVGINPLSNASVFDGKNKNIKEHVRNPNVLVNKFIFIILAVFLGFVGAQWFYAKQYKKGFLYLVFSWTAIPMILGFYQALKALLQKTDDTYLIYV